MLTGFNTDVVHAGAVFHVQTEDKGLGNPIVESLIYRGGAILTSRSASYADLVVDGAVAEERLFERMELQHQRLITEIQAGRLGAPAAAPFGAEHVTERSLDDVVLEFLRQHVDADPLQMKLLDWQVLRAGTRPTLRLRVQRQRDGAPIPEIGVTVRLCAADTDPRELFSSATDHGGFVEATFEIPDPAGSDPELVCEAILGPSRAVLRQRVRAAMRR